MSTIQKVTCRTHTSTRTTAIPGAKSPLEMVLASLPPGVTSLQKEMLGEQVSDTRPMKVTQVHTTERLVQQGDDGPGSTSTAKVESSAVR
jgi:hypothetical protein